MFGLVAGFGLRRGRAVGAVGPADQLVAAAAAFEVVVAGAAVDPVWARIADQDVGV